MWWCGGGTVGVSEGEYPVEVGTGRGGAGRGEEGKLQYPSSPFPFFNLRDPHSPPSRPLTPPAPGPFWRIKSHRNLSPDTEIGTPHFTGGCNILGHDKGDLLQRNEEVLHTPLSSSDGGGWGGLGP